jgi:hypothetical protein
MDGESCVGWSPSAGANLAQAVSQFVAHYFRADLPRFRKWLFKMMDREGLIALKPQGFQGSPPSALSAIRAPRDTSEGRQEKELCQTKGRCY